MRERFAAVCVEPFGGLEGHHLPFASFSHKLGGLRWQVVTEFCRGVTSQCLVFFGGSAAVVLVLVLCYLGVG